MPEKTITIKGSYQDINKELSQCFWLGKEVKSLMERIENLESIATKITTTYNEISVSSTPNNKRLESTIIKLADLREKLNEYMSESAEQYSVLINQINSVDDSLTRQILTYRYMDNLSWQQVANRMGNYYTEDGCRKIARRYIEKYWVTKKN